MKSLRPIFQSGWAFLCAGMLWLTACGGVHSGHLFAVPDENSTFLKKSKGIAVRKEGIAIVAAPLNEVKEVDGFYLIVFNLSGQWVSFDRSQIRMLDHNGVSIKPLDKKEQTFRLGARFQPKLPPGIRSEVFRWDRALNVQGDWVSPLNPEEVFRTSVMSGGRTSFFVYFPHHSSKSPRLTLVVPNIEFGSSMEKQSFLFRFEVQKE